MKKLLMVFLGVAAVCLLGLVSMFSVSGELVKVADNFFTAIRHNDLKQADTYLSDHFQSVVSRPELEAFVATHSLTEFSESDWKARTINSERGSLLGAIKAGSDTDLPVVIRFVRADSQWKIYSILIPEIDNPEAMTDLMIPSSREQVRLVSESMRVFSESLKARSMEAFYGYVSNLWQKQFTVEHFDRFFAELYETGIDLSELPGHDPHFYPDAMINDKGRLIIMGDYLETPVKLSFEHSYVYEGLSWKLAGFQIDVE